METRLIPDEQPLIERTLIELVDVVGCALVLTTGGTGPAPRDVTPEATLAVAHKVLPGFGEEMRRVSLRYVPTAILSRQVGVVRGRSLILNLPGQPKAIKETLDGIFAAVPYCIDLIGGPYVETDEAVCKAFRPEVGAAALGEPPRRDPRAGDGPRRAPSRDGRQPAGDAPAARRRAGIAAVVASALCFGAMAIMARVAYASGIDTTTLLALRFSIAAVVMLAFVPRARRRAGRRVPRWRRSSHGRDRLRRAGVHVLHRADARPGGARRAAPLPASGAGRAALGACCCTSGCRRRRSRRWSSRWPGWR